MQEAHPRLIICIGAALVLAAGTAAPVVGAEAAMAQETECVAEVEPNDVRGEGSIFAGETCISGTLVEPGAGVALELVLDTSGSMLERLGKNTKLEVAERTLIDIVDQLPAGTPLALRTFKAKPRSCATVLRVPLEPLRPKAMKQTIKDLPARKGTRTPLAKAIKQVSRDMEGFEGHRVVMVVTDGKEDCDGDPAAAIAGLSEAGYTTTVHLIGYALPDDEALRADLAEWAAIGGGWFLEATDRSSLTAALETAITAPYLVFDESGALVAQGIAGDDGVQVEAGVYGVEVLGDPPSSVEAVEVEAGAVIELPAAT